MLEFPTKHYFYAKIVSLTLKALITLTFQAIRSD
nr:MAG TPA: hypothetical protein [Caudoviricetes sp.]